MTILYKALRPSTSIHYCAFQPIEIKLIFCHLLTGNATWTDIQLAAPFWRLYWNPTPGARIILNSQRINLTPKTIALIPPFTSFKKETDCPVEHFHMHFQTGPIFQMIPNELFEFRPPEHIIADLEKVIDLLYKKKVEELNFLMVANGVLFWALCSLSAIIPAPVALEPRMQELCGFIDQNYTHPISNTSLAARLAMNTNAFIALFKKAIGQTPRQYIVRKRIEKACRLLLFSDKSIDAIADEIGFCGRDYFSQTFQNRLGVGPATYRKTQLGKAFGDAIGTTLRF